MTMQYLSFATAAAASAQSSSDWAKVLGHPTISSNATKFLWAVLVHPTDGTALGQLSDETLATVMAKMTPAQQTARTAALMPASDPLVVATLAAIANQVRH